MWTVVYVSQSKEISEKLAEVFLKNEIISRIRRSSGDDENSCCYEVLVPGTELEKAQDLIFENELF